MSFFIYTFLGVSILLFASLSARYMRENSRLRRDTEFLRKELEGMTKDEEDNEEDDEEDPEVRVGDEAVLNISGWRVRGKIESVASSSNSKKLEEVGFRFRAHGDPNTLWIPHGHYGLDILPKKSEEEDATKPEANTNTEEPYSLGVTNG